MKGTRGGGGIFYFYRSHDFIWSGVQRLFRLCIEGGIGHAGLHKEMHLAFYLWSIDAQIFVGFGDVGQDFADNLVCDVIHVFAFFFFIYNFPASEKKKFTEKKKHPPTENEKPFSFFYSFLPPRKVATLLTKLFCSNVSSVDGHTAISHCERSLEYTTLLCVVCSVYVKKKIK